MNLRDGAMMVEMGQQNESSNQTMLTVLEFDFDAELLGYINDKDIGHESRTVLANLALLATHSRNLWTKIVLGFSLDKAYPNSKRTTIRQPYITRKAFVISPTSCHHLHHYVCLQMYHLEDLYHHSNHQYHLYQRQNRFMHLDHSRRQSWTTTDTAA
ncbi:unnamed protein product [Absidia cylindrospora]